MRAAILLAGFLIFGGKSSSGSSWLDPMAADVVTILCMEDTQFSCYNGPAGQEEWLLNYGASERIRIKGFQDITALKFDLSPYRGKTVLEAELHLAQANTAPVFALVVSTIQSPWKEGSGRGTPAQIGESCWRWKSRPKDSNRPGPQAEWTFPQSDFSASAFGNYGSLVSYGYNASGTFNTYSIGSQNWLRMKLDPDVVHALILDSFGLSVTDPRGYQSENPQIHTKESNRSLSPQLRIRFSSEQDRQPPEAVGSLRTEAGPLEGEVILSFTAPANPQAEKAFGYRVRSSTQEDFQLADDIDRWRIPRPASPGTAQRLILEGLLPETTYYGFIQPYDQAGNPGPAARISFILPHPPKPILPNTAIPISHPQGKSIREIPEALRYWACSEVTQVNPVTGNRMNDGYTEQGGDEYKKSNIIWDAERNSVILSAARNEVVGFQLILERLIPALSRVQVTVSDLLGSENEKIPSSPYLETFLLHYVKKSDTWYPDPAIPLSPPFPTAFSIPDSHHNPQGVNQSIWFDLYIPKNTAAGRYRGTINVSANELTIPLKIGLEAEIHSVEIPDNLSFIVDLNGYGNPWDYGNVKNTRLRWFQSSQKHRMSLNTLPYSWNGGVIPDRAPKLTGKGKDVRVQDWTGFDEAYGSFFDGSAFASDHPLSPYFGPGMKTPVSTFYTPFFESWPIPVLDPESGFDAAGKGGSYWNRLIDTTPNQFWSAAPDVRQAFPESYREGVGGIVREWFEHAESRGWHRTNFQVYLNHKYYYNSCDALWILEECSTADDFRAVGFFHSLFQEGAGQAKAPHVAWHWRLDISDRWSQHYHQLDNIINWYCMSGSDADWFWPHLRYRNLLNRKPENWIWYGTGPSPMEPGIRHAQRFLQAWSQGLDGGVPYWDNFQTNWSTAEPLSVVYSGRNVPGFGAYEGPIMSIRVKMMRQAQQVLELANLLSHRPGWNRQRVAAAIGNAYGDRTSQRSFTHLKEEDLYRLRAALIAALESELPPQTPIRQSQMY